MQYTKQAIDFPRQIELLRERGMVIETEEYAIQCLDSISYFRLANYWKTFEIDKKHHFAENTRFEDVLELYFFDRELRELLFSAIQSIEIALRTRVIHHFSLKYGPFWFLDESLFKDKGVYDHCIDNLKKEMERSKEDFIEEHYLKYDNPKYPPVWKTLEIATFGTLSKFFCNFRDPDIKKRVAQDFHLTHYVYLENWIKCANILRNVCAHHGRLWNRRMPIAPKLPAKLPLPWIKNNQVVPVKLYAHLCYIAYLDKTIRTSGNFANRLLKIISPKTYKTLRSMGFPINWAEETMWNQ